MAIDEEADQILAMLPDEAISAMDEEAKSKWKSTWKAKRQKR